MGKYEYDPPIILGRPFLNTIKAIIYIGSGEVHMHFPSEKVRRYFIDPNYLVEDSKQVRIRRRRRNQRRQIIKDGWADYEAEVIRSKDIQLEQNCPKETVAPSQVWREKIVIHEEERAAGTTDYAIQRISGRLRKWRVPFGGLNALPKGKLSSYPFPFNSLLS